MDATAFHSVIMVFWKATAFPLWRAIERRWNRKVGFSGVFCDCSDASADLLCQLYRHLMPHTSCFHRKGIEAMCVAQFGILDCLFRCQCLGCCTWCDSCVGNVGLCLSVRYCHIPGHSLSSCPGQKSCPIVPSGLLLLSSIRLTINYYK